MGGCSEFVPFVRFVRKNKIILEIVFHVDSFKKRDKTDKRDK